MTSTPAAEFRELVARVTRLAELAAVAGSVGPDSAGSESAAPLPLSRDQLLQAVTDLGELQAVLDGVKVAVAGEVVRRSVVLDDENPVKHVSHASPATLLAERWRLPLPAARQFCRVADGVAPRRSILGEILPAPFPALAAALAQPLGDAFAREGGDRPAGRPVSVHQAAVIVRELTKAAPGCSIEEVADGERLLVTHAPDLSVEETRVLAAHVRDRLDQDGIEPREDRQHRRRSLTISTTTDGMTHVDWYLDSESAAYVVTAIDSLVGAQLRRVQFCDPGALSDDGTPVDMQESRTLAQIRSDEATEVFRHLASCATATAEGRPPVSVVVRIALEALVSGVGRGEIDGIETPVSAATVRRMAADADIIPVVLGGDGEVLDLGRSRRLFTRRQKLALAERDGGCAWTGCPHPPSYTEAHHIRWWNADAGPTDLDNGILLCGRHHHRVHDDGWQIEVRRHVPYFIPPAHIDLRRQPRRGGRITLPERAA